MNNGWLAGAALETRRALRGLLRSPGFAAGIVLVLGVAIAGMATVATAAYALFFKPLPYANPEQLMRPTAYSHSMGFDLGLPPAMLAEVRDMPMVLDIAAYQTQSPSEDARGNAWRIAAVTPNLTAVLGARPRLGRPLTTTDAESSGVRAALISESLWRARFGSDPGMIGNEVRLEDHRIRVVGIMPAAFAVPSPQTDIWFPLRFSSEQLAPDKVNQFIGLEVIVRLRSGYTADQFQAALRAHYADDPRLAGIRNFMGLEFQVEPLREAWTEGQRQSLTLIGQASLLVLIAAVLNVAGLWLARLLSCSHDQAIQAALGAGPWRGLARTAVELAVLGVMGAGLALALTPGALDWLAALGMLDADRPLMAQGGAAMLVVTLGILLASALPVMLAAGSQVRRLRRGVASGLAAGGRSYTGSGARARRVLCVVQIGVAVGLLCVMTLLLRSWHALLTEDLGFEPRRLLAAQIYPPDDREHRPNASDPKVRAALDSLRALPGVESVAHTNVAPFTRSESITTIRMPRQDNREGSVRTRAVGDDFFKTAGIDVIRGRAFGSGDSAGGHVIVDEYFVSQHFPDGEALGQVFQISGGKEMYRDVVITGVVRTAKYRAPDEEPDRGSVYLFQSEPSAGVTVLIAARGSPASLVEPVKQTLERILGPDRTGSVVPMQTLVRNTIRHREPQLILLGLFAIETLVLAGLGLFSLLAYSVKARTAEFGVRQAVGARPARIRQHVLADALRLLLPGLALGLSGAGVAGYLITSRLYEVTPTDPATWFVTAGTVALIVLAASLWPAYRASRIQPTEALRYE